MSGFTALNVEPEDTLEEEIDDTKEIQIEEAFKLYQNALKLHSQGPAYYHAADEAYQELFRSEVFKYPEVISEFNDDHPDEPVGYAPLPPEPDTITLVPGNAADSAANSLPQLIYLSYKNRAQFILDVAHHNLSSLDKNRGDKAQYYYAFCRQSLESFASALERDDTDLDLWKKASRISQVLSTRRIIRFCLESVLAADDDSMDQAIDLSGLDEALACGDLVKVVTLVQDDLALLKMGTSAPKPDLLALLQASNDPYPFLPGISTELGYHDDAQRPGSFEVEHVSLKPAAATYEALGVSILGELQNANSDTITGGSGRYITISLPRHAARDLNHDLETKVRAPDQMLDSAIASATPVVDRDPLVQADVENSPASFHSAQDGLPDGGSNNAFATADAVEVPIKAPQSQNGTAPHIQDEIKLPTRKRSSTAAGMDEPEARTKSKRLRARESMAELAAQEEENVLQETNQYHLEQLAVIEDADEHALNHLNRILDKLGFASFGPATDARNVSWREEAVAADATSPKLQSSIEILFADIKQAICFWSEDKHAAIMFGHGSKDTAESSIGLALFLKHLKANMPARPQHDTTFTDNTTIDSVCQSINLASVTIFDVCFLWLMSLLSSNAYHTGSQSAYMTETWSASFRQNLIDIVLQADEYLVHAVSEFVQSPRKSGLSRAIRLRIDEPTFASRMFQVVQSLFEIHLDLYVAATNPESRANELTKLEHKDRLERWSQLATDSAQLYQEISPASKIDHLSLRFIWATAKSASLIAGNDKSHGLACLFDLRATLVDADTTPLLLPNNEAMPQISVAAVDQDISRLSTLDFFMSIFDNEDDEPVEVIFKLEPILESPSTSKVSNSSNGSGESPGSADRVEELRSFLDLGDAFLKLYLWKRLQNAYVAINYTPKVISCYLRSLEIIAVELQAERHLSQDDHTRQISMLQWLHDADDVVAKMLAKLGEEPNPFECIDAEHLSSSMSAILFFLKIIHSFVILDDSIRVGQTALPLLRTNTAAKQFEKSRDRLRATYVRLWTVLYHMLKEADAQSPQALDHPADEFAEYIRNIHNALGHRQYCKHCNKLFVKLAKNELLTLQTDIDYSEDIAQILFDMYSVRVGNGVGDIPHGCTPDLLERDKKTAVSLIPLIMKYAMRLTVQNLVKSDLKTTIDKIQQASGHIRTSPALSFNKKQISAFLKAPINPQAVYRSVKGIGDLVTKTVEGDYAKIAAQGWYLLLGRMSLAKFRSTKRVNPTPTEDLDTAATFLRSDLEHSIANWETWYRLAQVTDAKIEDSLIWNATKLNDSRAEIATLERSAINAYTMAMTMAMRTADDTPTAVEQLSEMYADFAMRLYASSRPPLSMEAYATDKHMRHLSSNLDSSMSKTPFIPPFREYSVWAFAVHLLSSKLRPVAREWHCHYLRGKCLWKMFQSKDNASARSPVTVDQVLVAFTDAVEAVPKKEKSSDYILEPHYKLVSVVHKLVKKNLFSAKEGVSYLQVSQFSASVRSQETEEGHIEWEAYVLNILKKLGVADKLNWHHRITARAAHVIYQEQPNLAGAVGARNEFTKQIFTKTMTMQVWKPEYERPGRHYVYTGRYLTFFVKLLDVLDDRSNMEQLVRRIRRKTADFLNHSKIWEDTALTYVGMLRRAAEVEAGKERNVFDKVSHEEFATMSEKVEAWAHERDNDSIYIRIIQDAIELKKLNNSLMKGGAIDELIGDTYATMYERFVLQQPTEEVLPQQSALSHGTFLNMTTESAPTGDDNLDRMRLNNLLSAQSEGLAPPISIAVSAVSSLATGVQTPPRATTPADPVRVPTPNKPTRQKIVSKREVQRKAESAVNRPAPPKTPTLGRKFVVEIPSNNRGDRTQDALQATVAGTETDGAEERSEHQHPNALIADPELPRSETSSRRREQSEGEQDDQNRSQSIDRRGSEEFFDEAAEEKYQPDFDDAISQKSDDSALDEARDDAVTKSRPSFTLLGRTKRADENVDTDDGAEADEEDEGEDGERDDELDNDKDDDSDAEDRRVYGDGDSDGDDEEEEEEEEEDEEGREEEENENENENENDNENENQHANADDAEVSDAPDDMEVNEAEGNGYDDEEGDEDENQDNEGDDGDGDVVGGDDDNEDTVEIPDSQEVHEDTAPVKEEEEPKPPPKPAQAAAASEQQEEKEPEKPKPGVRRGRSMSSRRGMQF